MIAQKAEYVAMFTLLMFIAYRVADKRDAETLKAFQEVLDQMRADLEADLEKKEGGE